MIDAPTQTDPQPGAWPAMSIARAHELITQSGSPLEMETKTIRGIETRVWKGPPHTFRDIFLAGRAWGGRTFMLYEDERVSFAAFANASLILAAYLQKRGLNKGDRVALAIRNLPEWPVAFFGTLLAGGVATPLNAWWTGQELEFGLTDCGARFAIVDSERLLRLSEHLPNCPDLQHIYVCRDEEEVGDPRVSRLENLIGGPNAWASLPAAPLPDVAIDPEDNATLFYTSGTTGRPKGALGTHRAGSSNVLARACSLARMYLRRGEVPPTPDPAVQRRGLLTIPLFHVTGCFAAMGPGIVSGDMMVMMRRWDPEAAFALIERERITSAGGVPTIAWQLLEHPAREDYDLSSLEVVSYGGAPAAPELVRRIRQLLPNAVPGTGWGMTETSATFTHHVGEDYEHRPDSCGPALPVCDMKIVGAGGETLRPGEIGELWARGPNVVSGYWGRPDATAETFVDGWVKTGDLARLDDEGFCYIVDRAKDMIIRGGENIYSAEVEAALHEHPDVLDAALVPIPHMTLGEEPGAVVTLRPGSTVDDVELKAFLSARIAAFKIPVRILYRPDLLPRNANGKIMKGELKPLFV